MKEPTVRLYFRRWIILALFFFYSFSSNLTFMQYTVIADKVTKYYNVSHGAVNWSVNIYFLTYSVLFFPASYIATKWSLYTCIGMGSIGTALGAWIRVLSIYPDRFWVALLGQGFGSVFQLLVLPLAPKLASAWFSLSEISTAFGIAAAAQQLAISIGSLLPTLVVQDDNVQNGLFINNLTIAILNTIVIVLVVIFFRSKPPTPPSIAQLKIDEISYENSTTYVKFIKILFINKSFLLYAVVFAITTSLQFPLVIVINQLVLNYYPTASVHVGIISLTGSLGSFIGYICGGLILDRYRKFRETTWASHALSVLSTVTFLFTMDQGLSVVYITYNVSGFFFGLLMSVGIQCGVEITYPIPEPVTGGFMTLLHQLLSVVTTIVYQRILTSSLTYANIFLVLGYIVSNSLFVFVKFDLKRQASERIT